MTTREHRLRELVDRWRYTALHLSADGSYLAASAMRSCANELAAILDEPIEVSDEMVEHVWDQLPTNVDITRRDVRLVLIAALNLKEPGQ